MHLCVCVYLRHIFVYVYVNVCIYGCVLCTCRCVLCICGICLPEHLFVFDGVYADLGGHLWVCTCGVHS